MRPSKAGQRREGARQCGRAEGRLRAKRRRRLFCRRERGKQASAGRNVPDFAPKGRQRALCGQVACADERPEANVPAPEWSDVPAPALPLCRSGRSLCPAAPWRKPTSAQWSPLLGAHAWVGYYGIGYYLPSPEAERSEARDFLLSVGLVNHGGDILRLRHCTSAAEAERSEARLSYLSLYFCMYGLIMTL